MHVLYCRASGKRDTAGVEEAEIRDVIGRHWSGQELLLIRDVTLALEESTRQHRAHQCDPHDPRPPANDAIKKMRAEHTALLEEYARIVGLRSLRDRRLGIK